MAKHRCWKAADDDFLIAEQAYSHVPRVLIMDRISRRVYESLHLDEFNHQLEDGIWIEQTPEATLESGLSVSQDTGVVDSHISQLIMMIDQFTDDLHPLRHSNSYKFLKKKYNI